MCFSVVHEAAPPVHGWLQILVAIAPTALRRILHEVLREVLHLVHILAAPLILGLRNRLGRCLSRYALGRRLVEHRNMVLPCPNPSHQSLEFPVAVIQ